MSSGASLTGRRLFLEVWNFSLLLYYAQLYILFAAWAFQTNNTINYYKYIETNDDIILIYINVLYLLSNIR